VRKLGSIAAMKPVAIVMILSCGLLLVPGPVRAELPWADILALHWHPETASQARRQTLALAALLEDPEAEVAQWQQLVDSRVLTLQRSADLVDPAWGAVADGMFAWLVHARDQNLPSSRPSAMLPVMFRVSDLLQRDGAEGRLARLYPLAALQAPMIWQRLQQRILDQELPDVDAQILAYWQPLLTMFAEVEAEADSPDWIDHAYTQASRVRVLSELGEDSRAGQEMAALLLDQAAMDWSTERRLTAIWGLLEGLIRLTAGEPSISLGTAYQDQLVEFAQTDVRELRQLDSDLPTILEMMLDAAGYLAVEEPGIIAAMAELADAYARLALFVSDASFYLDQPVREDVRRALALCNPDPLMVGPLPREQFETCLQRLTALVLDDLQREELTGGAAGPFASEFLRREMGLASWQRASYLDGYLDWRLQSACPPQEWMNVLEWSLLMQYLVHWVPQRPVFFGASRWQSTVDTIAERAADMMDNRVAWLDCMTGMGSVRRDPVQRLIELQERSHAALAGALQEARQQYYGEVTRPGADIDLDGGADQATAYRPETLMVTPCPGTETCGARVELPASRALLGLFPNAYLLADQISLGTVSLCYADVRWVDRQARPGRASDDQVANYHGHLSFDLIGRFVNGEDEDLVFHQRLTSAEPRHYLFASSDPELLDLDCPKTMAGEAVASRLPEGRPGLVPNRLTYFVSLPTTPESELIANWDRGAEWRDWFVTGGRVESLSANDGQALASAVQARLAELSSRRERQLAGRLLSPLTGSQTDPVMTAMAEVAENSALLRRVLEIHYPRVIRHHDSIRASVVGESGLLTRDRVRQLRDSGVPMIQVPTLGAERLTRLSELWQQLPVNLRESGQTAPELEYGLEQLESLIWISRAWPGGGELSAGQ
jgi:hypothetical protein